MDPLSVVFPSLATVISAPRVWEDLSLERWETRILPVLIETGRWDGMLRKKYGVDGHALFYSGNDAVLLEILRLRGREDPEAFSSPWSVYALAGLSERALLRRLKDYPDESTREELQSPWAAVCAEERAAILVNVAYKGV